MAGECLTSWTISYWASQLTTAAAAARTASAAIAASVLPVGALRPSGAVGIDVMSLVSVTFPASLRHGRPASLAYLNQMI